MGDLIPHPASFLTEPYYGIQKILLVYKYTTIKHTYNSYSNLISSKKNILPECYITTRQILAIKINNYSLVNLL